MLKEASNRTGRGGFARGAPELREEGGGRRRAAVAEQRRRWGRRPGARRLGVARAAGRSSETKCWACDGAESLESGAART